ncbi:hypothetical protein ACWJJH_13930 [Endozoicomonadaceae bacterium StTr2]
MLYVLKDEQGKINAVSEHPVSNDWEAVELDDEALHAFMQNNPVLGNKVMQETDAEFIRVLEDVIDLLIDKQIMQFTELPVPVQTKLLNRRRYREELREAADDTTRLINDDDDDDSIF